jgi:hypothetical protein
MTSNHIPVGIYVNLITDVIVPSLRPPAARLSDS